MLGAVQVAREKNGLKAETAAAQVRSNRLVGILKSAHKFLRAIREGGPWPIPWEEIRGTTWASLAAVQSLRHGFPVEAE